MTQTIPGFRHSKFHPDGHRFVFFGSRGQLITKSDQAESNRQQQALDFLEPRLGFFFGEAREFAAERDEIVVARDF
jgi:hypothetical protein